MKKINWQWAITDQALEALGYATSSRVEGITPEYTIGLDRLLETQNFGGVPHYDWPVHRAGKSWVDIEAFNEAFEVAIRDRFGAEMEGVDRAMLEASLELAKKMKEADS